jgi:hypothetical protein
MEEVKTQVLNMRNCPCQMIQLCTASAPCTHQAMPACKQMSFIREQKEFSKLGDLQSPGHLPMVKGLNVEERQKKKQKPNACFTFINGQHFQNCFFFFTFY